MYKLSVKTNFSAAHYLRGYKGECARMHGHTWGVKVTVGVRTLGDLGMSIDFKEIAAALEEIVGRFDHQTLNDLNEFADMNPTAENLARLVFESLSEKINSDTINVSSVDISESEKYSATYKKDAE